MLHFSSRIKKVLSFVAEFSFVEISFERILYLKKVQFKIYLRNISFCTSQPKLLLISFFSRSEDLSSNKENPELNIRVKRTSPDFSIINQFEVLRKRYLDTLRDRITRRPRVLRDQIQDNRDFMNQIG